MVMSEYFAWCIMSYPKTNNRDTKRIMVYKIIVTNRSMKYFIWFLIDFIHAFTLPLIHP